MKKMVEVQHKEEKDENEDKHKDSDQEEECVPQTRRRRVTGGLSACFWTRSKRP